MEKMEQQEVLKKYAYYYLVLLNMGGIPLKKDIILATDTGINRKEIQMAYNDIKKYNFEDSIIDYLCWISSAFLVYEMKKHTKGFESGFVPMMVLGSFLEICQNNSSDTNNMSRLFNKNYNYLIKLIEDIIFEKKFDKLKHIHVNSYIRDIIFMNTLKKEGINKHLLKIVIEANGARYGTFLKYIRELKNS